MRSVFFLLLAGVLAIAAIVSAVSTIRFLRQSEVAPGAVERLNAGGSHPQISFVTRRGERISYPQGGLVFGLRQGDVVQVRYRVDAPRASATLDRIGALWAVTILFAVLAIGFAWAARSTQPASPRPTPSRATTEP